jgi:hypothetical protein
MLFATSLGFTFGSEASLKYSNAWREGDKERE